MFIKVDVLPNGPHEREAKTVTAMVFVGPGTMIAPFHERGFKGEACKMALPDGRAIYLAHSFKYMETLIMGDMQRPGLRSDVDKMLGATVSAKAHNE